MGNVRDARAVAPGMGHESALVARCFRDVLVTRHARDAVDWRWLAQAADGGEMAVVLTADAPLRVIGADGVARDAPPGAVCFLHPHRRARIVTTGAVTCAWVPWRALAGIESELRAPEEVLPVTALGRGLRAFLASLVTADAESMLTTDHLVERLVAEMVFGVLLEAAPRPAGGGAVSRIDRARSVMLARRAEQGFDVSALAGDMRLSVRQLQRLFAADGSAPADELRRIRVDLAREVMREDRRGGLRIGEIAERAGFGDAAALRRAFALAGLPAPRTVRRAALA
ncbi:helix-turn-helix transcriptional regulator [Microbacterium xylanilyticum]